MSITEFVADVDRLLSRAHDLFPAAGAAGGQLPAAGVGGSVPSPPATASKLRSGASGAAASYQQDQRTAGGLDEQVRLAAAEAHSIGQQGRTSTGTIRDQARAAAAALKSVASTPAGARLIVATMNQHLTAMQGQVETTQRRYQAVSAKLRDAAAGYRRLPGKGPGTADAVPLDNDTQHDSGKPGYVVGDPRHMPWVAGPGGPKPPGPPEGPRWIEIGPNSGTFVRADELPGAVIKQPGELGPPGFQINGDPHRYIELVPHSGVWVPETDFPDAHFTGPNTFGPPRTSQYLPGSGIWLPDDSLIREPLAPLPRWGETRP